ncbi:MAG: hypothetical protein AAF658_10240 [Myxococcota bacterium]
MKSIGSTSERLRLVVLASMLTSVILVGAPVGSRVNQWFQATLEPLGIDLALRPVTADMIGILDRDGSALYEHEVVLVALKGRYPLRRIALETLPLEHVRVPLVLFLERVSLGANPVDLRVAVCTALVAEAQLPAIDGFVVELVGDADAGRDFGFNIAFRCPRIS